MLSVPAELTILALLVFANGLLAMAETAVLAASKTRLRKLAGEGSEGAGRALALAEEPARFLALVQLWLTLSGMIAGVLGGAELAGQFHGWLQKLPLADPWAKVVAVGAVTVGLSAFMVLFGELAPRRVGLAHPGAGRGAARPPHAHAGLAGRTLPRRPRQLATNGIARLIRLRTRPPADSVGDDEVRALVEQGLHAGVFQRAEKEMVEGVLALDQMKVTAVMTQRRKIVFLNLDDPEETNWRKIVTSGHSYFPVYQGNRDQILGLVAVKALWAHSAIGLPTHLKNLLVPPLLVPETMTAMQVLEQFKKTGRHVGVVTDEFGVVQGLVTLVDIFEAIAGDLPEAGRRAAPETSRRADGEWVIDASLPLGELKTLLGVATPLPHEAEAEFHTAGGFVVTQTRPDSGRGRSLRLERLALQGRGNGPQPGGQALAAAAGRGGDQLFSAARTLRTSSAWVVVDAL